jgi:hypothetical protein
MTLARRNLSVALACTAALTIAVAAAAAMTHPSAAQTSVCVRRQATSSVVAGPCGPPLPSVEVEAALQPTRLPKRRLAPIALQFAGSIGTDVGSQPPPLSKVTIEFDRQGAVSAEGLPVCRRRRLLVVGSRAARRICRASIVGTGTVQIEAEPSGPVSAPLTFFNAGTRGRMTRLLVYAKLPIGPPILATMKIAPTEQGLHGLTATMHIPRIEDGKASPVGFQLKIGRLFSHNGAARRSYAEARCRNGHLISRMEFKFSDGETVLGTVARPCKPTP